MALDLNVILERELREAEAEAKAAAEKVEKIKAMIAVYNDGAPEKKRRGRPRAGERPEAGEASQSDLAVASGEVLDSAEPAPSRGKPGPKPGQKRRETSNGIHTDAVTPSE